jgi:pimeloyl-ACP methyl ester carboxylesterase
MPYATTDDGVRLYFEETGSGRPLILLHEFAGDLRSFEPQMRHLAESFVALRRSIGARDKGIPAVGRRVSSPGHILGHARLSDIDAELEKFSMDPRRSPQ